LNDFGDIEVVSLKTINQEELVLCLGEFSSESLEEVLGT
jgi:hypothetical protein